METKFNTKLGPFVHFENKLIAQGVAMSFRLIK
jgi:hypothetical protein